MNMKQFSPTFPSFPISSYLISPLTVHKHPILRTKQRLRSGRHKSDTVLLPSICDSRDVVVQPYPMTLPGDSLSLLGCVCAGLRPATVQSRPHLWKAPRQQRLVDPVKIP